MCTTWPARVPFWGWPKGWIKRSARAGAHQRHHSGLRHHGGTQDCRFEWLQSFLKARALHREQKLNDLVITALYPLANLAGFVSGQKIVVDGGHIMCLEPGETDHETE